MGKRALLGFSLGFLVAASGASANVFIRKAGCYELRGEIVSRAAREIGVRVNRGSRSQETARVQLDTEAPADLREGQLVRVDVRVAQAGRLKAVSLTGSVKSLQRIRPEELAKNPELRSCR